MRHYAVNRGFIKGAALASCLIVSGMFSLCYCLQGSNFIDTNLAILNLIASLFAAWYPITGAGLLSLCLTFKRAPKIVDTLLISAVPTAVCLITTMWGAYWSASTPVSLSFSREDNCWQLLVLWSLSAVFCLSSLGVLVVTHKHRLFVGALLFNELWFLFGSTFIASMSITNRWL